MGSPGSTSSSGWQPPSIEHLHSLLPQYEISRLLGHGGMGAVYEGVQSNLDRKVAIKILPETLGEDEEALNFTERFKLEAKSMANLDHPGIISIHDFGQTSEGQLYFVMEFIDGMDIHQYLKHHGGKLPEESAIAIIAHVLDALGYAHERGIVHRDIKPANIMIKSDGRVKVADFGLVKRLSETGEGSPDSALTVSNVALGTPDYVAPESLEIGRTVDHRADLYAIGVMFYQLLTGAVPRGNFKPPSGKIEGLDPRLDAIVLKAMEADPEDRFADAHEFRIAIDKILSSPVPEDQHTGPVTPGGHRLHMTTVKKKTSPEPEETASPPTPARSDSQSPRSRRAAAAAAQKNKKLGPLALAAIIGLPVVAIGAGIIALVLWFGGKDEPVAQSSDPPPKAEKPKPQSTDPKPEPKPKPKEIAKASPAPAEETPETPDPEKKVASAVPDKSKSEAPSTSPSPAPNTSPEPTSAPKPTPPKVENDPVEKRLTDIDTKYRAVFEKPYQEALKKLNDQFIGALRREEAAATDTGNLDLVLAFQNEAKRIANGEGAEAADGADAPPKLKQLRQTWHAQAAALERTRGENLKLSHEKRDQSLQLYQQELVKAKNIAAAQRVKALREQFASDPEGNEAFATTKPVAAATPPRQAGNPLQPVITQVPKLEYPPKRPTRVGELIRVSLDNRGEPEVIATDVVEFRTTALSKQALTLKSDGELEISGGTGGHISFKEFESVASKLSDVVSFDLKFGSGEWAAALDSKENLTVWGHNQPVVVDAPSKLEGSVSLRALGSQGAGILSNGKLSQWPDNPAGGGDRRNWIMGLDSIVDLRAAGPTAIALSENGRVEISNQDEFSEDEQRKIERIRDAVAISSFGTGKHPAALILLATGEILPVGWPTEIYADGNPLPPNLSRDIERIYVGGVQSKQSTQFSLFGACLSKSQGWRFFGGIGEGGEKMDVEGLERYAENCFEIAITKYSLFGLRDPQPAAKPAPPVSVTPPTSTPRPTGNPLQPVITEVPKLEYPPKRPARTGELVTFSLKEMGDPQVLASEVVEFQTSEHGAGPFALTSDGRLKSFGTQKNPIETELPSVAGQLQDIVSFSTRLSSWGMALKSTGETIAWGGDLKPPVEQEQYKSAKLVRLFGLSGLSASGSLLNLIDGSKRAENVVDFQHTTNLHLKQPDGSERHGPMHVVLTDRGHVEIINTQRYSDPEMEQLGRIRDAVGFAVNHFQSWSAAMLVLRASGEVAPFGWSSDDFPDGNPLPNDLPRDIERVYVGGAPNKGRKTIGGVKSRSQGWLFFGKDVDGAALAKRANGCFQIAIRGDRFYGLRDPQIALKATPPSPPTAKAPIELPFWLREAKKEGGRIKVWGKVDGKPLNEREILQKFTRSDFTRVAAAAHSNWHVLIGIRKNDMGTWTKINGDRIWGSESMEFQALDRWTGVFIADGKYFDPMANIGRSELKVKPNALLSGTHNPFFFYQDGDGKVHFGGLWKKANPDEYDKVAEIVTADSPELLVKGGSAIFWVSKDNQFNYRQFKSDGTLGTLKPFETQPSRKIVDLGIRSRGNSHWIALDEAGNVFSENSGGSEKWVGFETPNAELSPAIAIRSSGGGTFAIQKPDGTWKSDGPNAEMNEVISKIGPAIDLAIAEFGPEDQLVIWIEPD